MYCDSCGEDGKLYKTRYGWLCQECYDRMEEIYEEDAQ